MTDFSADSLKRGSARMRGRRFLTSASPVGRLNRSGRGTYSPRECFVAPEIRFQGGLRAGPRILLLLLLERERPLPRISLA